MKRITNIVLPLVALLYIVSCHKVEPTYDKVVYDSSKSPIISAKNVPIALFTEERYEWEISVEAFNGIKDIKVNDEVILSYNNGQFIYQGIIPIVMPDVENFTVSLVVTDELDNETHYPDFTIASRSHIKSPFYLIKDFSGAGEILYTGNERRPELTYAVTFSENIAKNFGWQEVNITSDLDPNTYSTIRYGMPSMNLTNNITKWEHAVQFNAKNPNDNTSGTMLLKNHFYQEATAAGTSTTGLYSSMASYALSLIHFGTALDSRVITDVMAGIRCVKLDIYVDTKDVSDPNTEYNYDPTKHYKVSLAMACESRYNNTGSTKREGQGQGAMAIIDQTDRWVTLSFNSVGYEENPFTEPNPAPKNPPSTSEVDMIVLHVSPQVGGDGIKVSNAKYYIKNLRIEKVK